LGSESLSDDPTEEIMTGRMTRYNVERALSSKHITVSGLKSIAAHYGVIETQNANKNEVVGFLSNQEENFQWMDPDTTAKLNKQRTFDDNNARPRAGIRNRIESRVVFPHVLRLGSPKDKEAFRVRSKFLIWYEQFFDGFTENPIPK